MRPCNSFLCAKIIFLWNVAQIGSCSRVVLSLKGVLGNVLHTKPSKILWCTCVNTFIWVMLIMIKKVQDSTFLSTWQVAILVDVSHHGIAILWKDTCQTYCKVFCSPILGKVAWLVKEFISSRLRSQEIRHLSQGIDHCPTTHSCVGCMHSCSAMFWGNKWTWDKGLQERKKRTLVQ